MRHITCLRLIDTTLCENYSTAHTHTHTTLIRMHTHTHTHTHVQGRPLQLETQKAKAYGETVVLDYIPGTEVYLLLRVRDTLL